MNVYSLRTLILSMPICFAAAAGCKGNSDSKSVASQSPEATKPVAAQDASAPVGSGAPPGEGSAAVPAAGSAGGSAAAPDSSGSAAASGGQSDCVKVRKAIDTCSNDDKFVTKLGVENVGYWSEVRPAELDNIDLAKDCASLSKGEGMENLTGGLDWKDRKLLGELAGASEKGCKAFATAIKKAGGLQERSGEE
jgi:hypothetical protein